MKVAYSHYKLKSFLFGFLLLFDIVLNLIPTYNGSFVKNYMEIEDFRNLSLSLSNAVNTVVFAIIIGVAGVRSKSNVFGLTLVLFFLMFVSAVINLRTDSFIQLLGFIVIYLGLFSSCGWVHIKDSIKSIAFLLIILWSILPVIYLPFAPGEQYVYMFGSDSEYTMGTFCGFGFNRNDYGVYAGLSVLLLLFERFPKWFKYSCLVPLAIGIFLSQSRTALFGTVLVAFYYEWEKINKKNRIWLIVLAGVVFAAVLYASTIYEARFFSSSYGRDSLNTLFYQLIFDSPIFGYGGATFAYSSNYSEGSPCHNFIIQAAADYGIIAAFLFCILLYCIFIKSTKKSKALLVLLCIIGLFQPYFTLSLPKMYPLVFFLLIGLYNGENLYCKMIYETSRNHKERPIPAN